MLMCNFFLKQTAKTLGVPNPFSREVIKIILKKLKKCLHNLDTILFVFTLFFSLMTTGINEGSKSLTTAVMISFLYQENKNKLLDVHRDMNLLTN